MAKESVSFRASKSVKEKLDQCLNKSDLLNKLLEQYFEAPATAIYSLSELKENIMVDEAELISLLKKCDELKLKIEQKKALAKRDNDSIGMLENIPREQMQKLRSVNRLIRQRPFIQDSIVADLAVEFQLDELLVVRMIANSIIPTEEERRKAEEYEGY